MPISPVPKEIRDQYIKEGLWLRQTGQRQPDLEYNGVRYFLDNKGNNTWRLRNRASHSQQGAQRRAQQQNAALTKQDYISALGRKLGIQQYEADRQALQRVWNSRGTRGMDVDHIHSLGSGGLEHPNNFRLENSSNNRSEGARTLTPAQLNALMLSSDKTNQILLQGPKPTPRVRQQIINGSIHTVTTNNNTNTTNTKPNTKGKGKSPRKPGGASRAAFADMTGGYTGADSLPRRVDSDPLGLFGGGTFMLP